MLGSNFVKLLRSILKWRVNSSPNFASLFNFMKDNSYTFLAQRIYTLLKWSPLKWKFWRLRSGQVKICKISYVNFERTSQFLSKFYIPLQFHATLFLCTFLPQTLCTLLKMSPLKWSFLRLLSARVKFYQIFYVNFETTSLFL